MKEFKYTPKSIYTSFRYRPNGDAANERALEVRSTLTHWDGPDKRGYPKVHCLGCGKPIELLHALQMRYAADGKTLELLLAHGCTDCCGIDLRPPFDLRIVKPMPLRFHEEADSYVDVEDRPIGWWDPKDEKRYPLSKMQFKASHAGGEVRFTEQVEAPRRPVPRARRLGEVRW